jgi:hypothetical protein
MAANHRGHAHCNVLVSRNFSLTWSTYVQRLSLANCTLRKQILHSKSSPAAPASGNFGSSLSSGSLPRLPKLISDFAYELSCRWVVPIPESWNIVRETVCVSTSTVFVGRSDAFFSSGSACGSASFSPFRNPCSLMNLK